MNFRCFSFLLWALFQLGTGAAHGIARMPNEFPHFAVINQTYEPLHPLEIHLNEYIEKEWADFFLARPGHKFRLSIYQFTREGEKGFRVKINFQHEALGEFWDIMYNSPTTNPEGLLDSEWLEGKIKTLFARSYLSPQVAEALQEVFPNTVGEEMERLQTEFKEIVVRGSVKQAEAEIDSILAQLEPVISALREKALEKRAQSQLAGRTGIRVQLPEQLGGSYRETAKNIDEQLRDNLREAERLLRRAVLTALKNDRNLMYRRPYDSVIVQLAALTGAFVMWKVVPPSFIAAYIAAVMLSRPVAHLIAGGPDNGYHRNPYVAQIIQRLSEMGLQTPGRFKRKAYADQLLRQILEMNSIDLRVCDSALGSGSSDEGAMPLALVTLDLIEDPKKAHR